MEIEATVGSTLDEPVPSGCVPVEVPGTGNVPLDRGNGAVGLEDALDNGLETPVPVTDVGDPVPGAGYGVVTFESGNGAEDERSPVVTELADPVPGI